MIERRVGVLRVAILVAAILAVEILPPASGWAQGPPPAPQTAFKFDFGPGKVAPDYIQVLPTTVYTDALGYGLEPGATVTGIDRGGTNILRNDFLTSNRPFFFSVKVPEGNYNVTIIFGDFGGESVATVKAETRRLMLERVHTGPGQFETRTFTVNVRNSQVPPPPTNAPGGTQVRLNNREQGALHWDDKLTIEFNNARPCIAAVEITKVEDAIAVFLAGDSTVTDQPGEPGNSWGQMLPRFFGPGVAIANHAESGETLKSFITGMRLDKVLSQMKRGDYLFMQFGHNDQKQQWPQTYVEAFTTYKAYLKAFVAEARLRGAIPVLVTSMNRRTFDPNGKITNSLGDYPEAVRQTAKEENVALIDLNAMSKTFYEALGVDKAPLAFAGNGRDATHHNNYGSYELARCVVEAIKANKLGLTRFLRDDVEPFDPAHPDPVESFSVPASPPRTRQPSVSN
ncbi:MAG: rhamnogalacturonan acetylesterase [Pyrinomonadaceae bacterium]|nr:rhamnogalacturonan acetylesterase [Pyrinomonadaceae bacterium]